MIAIAELKDISKRYANRRVLDKITLQIPKGEVLALLGPNGSGKTTLLKILAFLEKPSTGEVRFQGQTITGKNIEKLRLQSVMVFQKTLLFNASVYDNVAYGLKMRKLSKNVITERVKETLHLVKLDGFEGRHAKRLSGGEQQRVALARALVLETGLLLLDEPTANLDPKNTQIVEGVISTVNRSYGTTVVMATHNTFQAQKLPDRIAMLNEGKLGDVGLPAQIFGKLSKNLASFAAVENTFRGVATPTGSGTTLIDIGDDLKLETTANRTGEVEAFINPQDMIISTERFASSARNLFTGTISKISEQDSVVRVEIEVVEKRFVVQITRRSFDEMNLNLGKQVYIAFKASNVQVI